MEKSVKNMINEHKQLVIRIAELDEFVYSNPKADEISRADFANMCLQLKAMRNYEEALAARLGNQGVRFIDGKYVTIVDEITPEDTNKDKDGKANKEKSESAKD